jgi:hypothetical protein
MSRQVVPALQLGVSAGYWPRALMDDLGIINSDGETQ